MQIKDREILMKTIKLKSAQQQILDILIKENKALSAYALLEKAKPFGFHAPMQVYRTLKKLADYGLILKLDCLNMYFAYESKHQYQLVTICTECQKTQVVDIPQLCHIIEQSIHPQNFSSKYQHLELLGQCALCRSEHKQIQLR